MSYICNLLSDNIISKETNDHNETNETNEMNEIIRMNKYYEASKDTYFNEIITYKKNKIIKLLSEINERIELNKSKIDNINNYKHLICEYEVEYKTTIKHLKNKLLYLDRLNEINKYDENIRIDIGRLGLDSSYNLHIINNIKQSFDKQLKELYNCFIGFIIVFLILL